MYPKAKLVENCQCYMQRVAFANAHGAPNFFRDDHAPQVVNSANNTDCFHLLKRLCIKIVLCYFLHEKENIPIFFAIILGEKMPYFTKNLQFSVKNSQWQIAQEKNLKSVYTALRTVYFVKRTKQIVVSQNFNNIYKHLFKTRFLRPFLVFYPLLFDILNKVLNIFKHFRNILFVYF